MKDGHKLLITVIVIILMAVLCDSYVKAQSWVGYDPIHPDPVADTMHINYSPLDESFNNVDILVINGLDSFWVFTDTLWDDSVTINSVVKMKFPINGDYRIMNFTFLDSQVDTNKNYYFKYQVSNVQNPPVLDIWDGVSFLPLTAIHGDSAVIKGEINFNIVGNKQYIVLQIYRGIDTVLYNASVSLTDPRWNFSNFKFERLGDLRITKE